MNFIKRFIFHQQVYVGSTWNNLKLNWDRLIHFRKCSCGHPLWMHVCYNHGTCIHGVCLAETFSFDPDVICCCQEFNDPWNKKYPPNKPELRQDTTKHGGSE